jgi:Lon protease-like protein
VEQLVLFPLNSVLFPSMPISLHVFEPRYKKMIGLCLENELPFGISLIRRGREALGPLPEPYRVGCTARITNANRLSLGRINLTAVGEQRFRAATIDNTGEYLQAEVEYLPVPEGDTQTLNALITNLRTWVSQYLQLLTKVELIQAQIYALPDDPIKLAYMAANLLQISLHQKQSLLEINTAHTLVEQCLYYYRREMSLMKSLSNPPEYGDNKSDRLN